MGPDCIRPDDGAAARRRAQGWVEIEPGVWGHPGPNPKPGLYPFIELDEARQEDGLSWGDLLVHWDAISSDLMEHYQVNVWDHEYMAGGSWLELRSRITALLQRPIHHDAFGKPVFTAMLQARIAAPVKTPG